MSQSSASRPARPSAEQACVEWSSRQRHTRGAQRTPEEARGANPARRNSTSDIVGKRRRLRFPPLLHAGAQRPPQGGKQKAHSHAVRVLGWRLQKAKLRDGVNAPCPEVVRCVSSCAMHQGSDRRGAHSGAKENGVSQPKDTIPWESTAPGQGHEKERKHAAGPPLTSLSHVALVLGPRSREHDGAKMPSCWPSRATRSQGSGHGADSTRSAWRTRRACASAARSTPGQRTGVRTP